MRWNVRKKKENSSSRVVSIFLVREKEEIRQVKKTTVEKNVQKWRTFVKEKQKLSCRCTAVLAGSGREEQNQPYEVVCVHERVLFWSFSHPTYSILVSSSYWCNFSIPKLSVSTYTTPEIFLFPSWTTKSWLSLDHLVAFIAGILNLFPSFAFVKKHQHRNPLFCWGLGLFQRTLTVTSYSSLSCCSSPSARFASSLIQGLL